MGIKNRLLEFANFHVPNTEKFALTIFGINNFFDNDQPLSLDHILQVGIHHTELNLNWLITGKGEMINHETTSYPTYKAPVGKTTEEILIEVLEEELMEQHNTIDELKKSLANKFPYSGNHFSHWDEQRLKESIALRDYTINKKTNQLFNAFILNRPSSVNRDPPYNFEFMRSLADEFRKYLKELEAMGKHKFFAGNHNHQQ